MKYHGNESGAERVIDRFIFGSTHLKSSEIRYQREREMTWKVQFDLPGWVAMFDCLSIKNVIFDL